MNKDLYDGLIIKPSLDELYHHGVKGQRKGVRHGPPYPLSRQKKGNGRLASGKGSVQKQKKKPRKVWSYAMLEKDLRTGRRELTKEEYDRYTMFIYDQYAKVLPWLNDYINDNDPDLERFDPLHPQESIQKYRDDLYKKSEQTNKSDAIKQKIQNAKINDKWDINFLEATQNAPWVEDHIIGEISDKEYTNKMIQEYEKYLEDPEKYWKNR